LRESRVSDDHFIEQFLEWRGKASDSGKGSRLEIVKELHDRNQDRKVIAEKHLDKGRKKLGCALSGRERWRDL